MATKRTRNPQPVSETITARLIGGGTYSPKRGVVLTREDGAFPIAKSLFDSLNLNNPIMEQLHDVEVEELEVEGDGTGDEGDEGNES